MPVDIQHAVMFTIAFVFIVGLMASSIYVMTTAMLSDAYRYQKVLELANEKLRLMAVNDGTRLYYAIRNMALTTIEIRDHGVITSRGRASLGSVKLPPGEVYMNFYQPADGVFYAVTERGNVFAVPIKRIQPATSSLTLNLVSLAPSYSIVGSPIGYLDNPDYTYAVGVSSYGYIFGFLLIDDPDTDAVARIILGPVPVSEIHLNRTIPYTVQASGTAGNVSATASLHFTIEGTRGRGQRYAIYMPIDVQGANGVAFFGCFGFAWQTVTSDFYSIDVQENRWGRCLQGEFGEEDEDGEIEIEGYVCDEVLRFALPAAYSFDKIATVLADYARGYLSATPVPPEGAVTTVLLVRCFGLASDEINRVTTTLNQPFFRVEDGGFRTDLFLPGRNRVYTGPDAYIYSIPMTIRINTKALVLAGVST